MNKVLYLLVLVVLTLACTSSTEEENMPQVVVKDSTLYGTAEFVFPVITPGAQLELENWSVFSDFYSEASTLKQIDLENLRLKTDKLLAHTDSLTKRIPDTLYTNAIYSRLIIVQTRVKLLGQVTKMPPVDKTEVEENIAETNRAVRNLITQINEKFQKDRFDQQQIENEKKELEKRRKFLDSVYQAELKDQQKDSV